MAVPAGAYGGRCKYFPPGGLATAPGPRAPPKNTIFNCFHPPSPPPAAPRGPTPRDPFLPPVPPQTPAFSVAVKVFICNLMTQANESLHMSASDHIQAIYNHSGRIFDHALVNSAPVSARMKDQYAGEHAEQVECDIAGIEKLGLKCVTGDFVEENPFARHATHRLCQELMELARIHRANMSRAALRR